MSWLVFVLGCALSLTGAVAITLGAAIIDVDRGSMQVLAGTVALTGGIVTIALGCILVRIESMRAAVLAEAARRERPPEPIRPQPDRPRTEPKAAPSAALAAPVPVVAIPVEEPPLRPEPQISVLESAHREMAPALAEAAAEPAPSFDVAGDEAPSDMMAPAYEPEFEDPGPAAAGGVLAGAELDAPTAALHPSTVSLAGHEVEAPFLDIVETPAELEAGSEGTAAPDPESEQALEAEPAALGKEGNAGQATIVGRYNAGGVAYVMFSDGSIEATRGDERFAFQSIAELKAFIESGKTTAPVT